MTWAQAVNVQAVRGAIQTEKNGGKRDEALFYRIDVSHLTPSITRAPSFNVLERLRGGGVGCMLLLGGFVSQYSMSSITVTVVPR